MAVLGEKPMAIDTLAGLPVGDPVRDEVAPLGAVALPLLPTDLPQSPAEPLVEPLERCGCIGPEHAAAPSRQDATAAALLRTRPDRAYARQTIMHLPDRFPHFETFNATCYARSWTPTNRPPRSRSAAPSPPSTKPSTTPSPPPAPEGPSPSPTPPLTVTSTSAPPDPPSLTDLGLPTPSAVASPPPEHIGRDRS